MIEKLKPYESLRPSGDAWLGQIPKHWPQKRLWSISSPRVERNPGNLPLLSVFLDRGVIPYGEGGGQVHAPSLDLSNYQVVHSGDFVLNNQQAWRGSVGVSQHHGIISPAYIVLRLNGELLPAYANYLFRCPRLVDQFVAASKGVGDIQRQVFWPFLRRVTVPIPSTAEQDAIVRFLDHANRRIDQFTRSKKKLIALLNEQKQASIRRAVTRGLDPSVKFKSSGVSWVGEVPEHWNIHRIKQVARIGRGKFTHRPRNDPSLYGGQFPFIQTGAVARAQRIITAYEQTLNDRGVAVSKVFPKGTLVMTIAANIGDVAILGFDACFPDSIVAFMPGPTTDQEFLYLVFSTMKHEWLREAPVNTQGNLNVERIGAMCVPMPPRVEQERITNFVTEATRPLDAAVAQARKEIALILEYRARFIADVVTGQLDVRAVAAALPDPEPDVTPPQTADDEEPHMGDTEAA